MKRPADLARLRNPVALLRRDPRQLGVRRGARAWGLSPSIALSVAAGLAVPTSVVRAVLEYVLAQVRR